MIRASFINALSIAALLYAVNAGAKTLSSFNKHKSHTVAKKTQCAQLADAVLRNGKNPSVPPVNFAEMIGLSAEASLKDVEIRGHVTRDCWVAYEKSAAAPAEASRPMAIYFIMNTASGHDGMARYFRVGLDGKLEKSVQMMGKYDDEGKPVPGTGKEFDEDVHAPKVRAAFEKEMDFWLKDWLPRQEKAGRAGKKKGARP
ncbi:MAG: hypothetical protein KGM24_12990 [Elusimicrobia bacterium]|nr:hypothetical protein [Elusimicrobiota bacterium]